MPQWPCRADSIQTLTCAQNKTPRTAHGRHAPRTDAARRRRAPRCAQTRTTQRRNARASLAPHHRRRGRAQTTDLVAQPHDGRVEELNLRVARARLAVAAGLDDLMRAHRGLEPVDLDMDQTQTPGSRSERVERAARDHWEGGARATAPRRVVAAAAAMGETRGETRWRRNGRRLSARGGETNPTADSARAALERASARASEGSRRHPSGGPLDHLTDITQPSMARAVRLSRPLPAETTPVRARTRPYGARVPRSRARESPPRSSHASSRPAARRATARPPRA